MSDNKKNKGISAGAVASFLTQDAFVDEEDSQEAVIDGEENDDEVEDPSKKILDDDEEEEGVEEQTDDEDNDKEETNEDKDVPVIEDFGEYEPLAAAYLEEKLYEKLGWDLNEDDKRADSVDSIVDLLKQVIEENSTPIYSSEEIEKLDDYVRNGGNLSDYLRTRYSENFDIEKADIEKESDQERILQEYFRTQGYSDDRILKKIQKYEDTGILQDEAEEALDLLKNIKEKESEKLLKEQEEISKRRVEEQQKFINDVSSYIDNLKDSLGVPLTKIKKDKLKANILKIGKDGMTEYQRVYNKSIISNLVDSAFLATMREDFEVGVTKKASSKAAKKFKETIQSGRQNQRQKSGGGLDPKVTDLLRKAAAGLK